MLRPLRSALLLAAVAAAPIQAQAPAAAPPLSADSLRPLGTLREQAALQQEWLRLRLERVLPHVMRENGVDMWIVPMREYNEDPVFRALVAPTTLAARRRTIYVFFDRGASAGVERIAIGGTSQGGLYDVVRDPDARTGVAGAAARLAEPFGPEQWKLLTDVVSARDPKVIAVDISRTHAFSDGLTVGEWEQMKDALGPVYAARVVRRERLPLDYLGERVPEMLPTYRRMMELVHATIATAFSSQVVRPGTTTTDDVVWWLRQRVNDLGLGTWFHPSVEVQRRGVEMADSARPVIQRGDVLHVDFGITALGLNTDTQHMGYVLRAGETDAPAGLKAALRRANRLQDIVLDALVPGRSGDDALHASLAAMRAAGIDGSVYTHPIGDHGHGAGPLVGLWDRQDGVIGRGAVPVRPSSWFSIELQATSPVAEWGGQPVRMALEEDAFLDADGSRHWVLRRQEAFHLVR
ncbi:MAG TPA: M24 family metallopeptidase [Longimicrobiales bacterium]|nr:M24 family metallopeptidase [Longimicrobiales bacterium]